MTATVAGIHLGIDTHANRPAGNAVPDGSLYSCSDHLLVYKSNYAGSSWATWATLPAGTGNVATDTVWDAAGDLVQGTGADTAAKLSAGTAGYFLKAGGASTANAWAARELDYVQDTTGATPTATTEATANTVVTGSAVVYDGSTTIIVEFFSPNAGPDPSAGAGMSYWLYDGASSIGKIGFQRSTSTQVPYAPIHCLARITPSAASHTYSIRASVTTGTGTIGAGAGGAGVSYPLFIRITRAI